MFETLIPLCFALTLAAAASLWVRRRDSRTRLVFATGPIFIFALLCSPPVSYLGVAALEWPYPPLEAVPEYAQVIVVLGGVVRPPDRVRIRTEVGESTFTRCSLAAELHRTAPGLPVLLTGGVVGDREGPSEASVMKDLLDSLGVRVDNSLTEESSTSTYENALHSAKLLRRRGLRRVVLVTDAIHMYRATRCFRKQGLDVTPAACRHTATGFQMTWQDVFPTHESVQAFASASHEWIGIAIYWLRGRI